MPSTSSPQRHRSSSSHATRAEKGAPKWPARRPPPYPMWISSLRSCRTARDVRRGGRARVRGLARPPVPNGHEGAPAPDHLLADPGTTRQSRGCCQEGGSAHLRARPRGARALPGVVISFENRPEPSDPPRALATALRQSTANRLWTPKKQRQRCGRVQQQGRVRVVDWDLLRGMRASRLLSVSPKRAHKHGTGGPWESRRRCRRAVIDVALPVTGHG